MTTTSDSENFFEKALDSAVAFVEKLFKGAKSDVASIEASIAKFGNSVVNEYKTLAANPTIELAAEWFIKIAEAIDPDLVPLISGIELEFPKLVSIATGVLTEIEKPIGEQLADGLAALEKITGLNVILGANAKGGISAAVQNYVLTNNATTLTVATPAQLITAAQVVHQQLA